MNSISFQYVNGRNNTEHWRYNTSTMTLEIAEKNESSMLRVELHCEPTHNHNVDAWPVTVKEAYLGEQFHASLNIYLSQKLLAANGSVTLSDQGLHQYRIGFLVSNQAQCLPPDIASWLQDLLHSDLKMASGY